MAESIGESIDNLQGDDEALKQFEKKRVGRSVFFACDCVAYTPEQLGLKRRSRRPADAEPVDMPPGAPVLMGAAQKKVASWPDGVVRFRFTTPTLSAEAKALFREACLMWERAVGNNAAGRKVVSFVEIASARAGRHVRVRGGTPKINQASTGAVGDAFIAIGFLNKGSIAHELGHVLGLVHEHQRHDRDQFVTRSAAVAGNANFRLHSRAEDTVRTPYDFGSIMHYGREVILNDQRVVALTPKPQFQAQAVNMGQRNAPSPHDVAAIREIYA
jgi:hypothetical protein